MTLKFIEKNKLLSAFFAGLFSASAFAPLHFFPSFLAAISLFYFLLDGAKYRKKENFYLGFSFGFGHFLAGVYWIAISLLVDAKSFAWLIPFALTLIPAVLACYFGLLAISYKFIVTSLRLEYSAQKIVIFSGCWLFFEVLRSTLFTGFPWNLAGYVLMFSDSAAQSASIFGIYGLSFFAVLFSLLPVVFFSKKSRLDKGFFYLILILFIANYGYGYLRLKHAKIVESDKKLRLVQGNIKQEMKWNPEEKYENLLRHIEMSKSDGFEDVDLVIWSETSVPYVIEENSELLAKLTEAAPQNGTLLTGALRLSYKDWEKTEISNVWNSVFAINRQGILGFYDKRHLVPFGEYIPLQNYLPFLTKITDGSLGFSEGEGAKTMAASGIYFNPLVCYEAIFTNEILDKNSRPDLLVNLTNDAWFGNSSGPYQHFDMVKMRAIEYGIPLARVANTGITAFIDPYGRVIKKINLNQSKTIDANLVENLAPTIYTKYMYIPITLIIMMMLFLIFLYKFTNGTRQDYSNRSSYRSKASRNAIGGRSNSRKIG